MDYKSIKKSRKVKSKTSYNSIILNAVVIIVILYLISELYYDSDAATNQSSESDGELLKLHEIVNQLEVEHVKLQRMIGELEGELEGGENNAA